MRSLGRVPAFNTMALACCQLQFSRRCCALLESRSPCAQACCLHNCLHATIAASILTGSQAVVVASWHHFSRVCRVQGPGN